MRFALVILSLVLGFAACKDAAEEKKQEAAEAQVEKNLLPTNLVSNPNTANGIDTATLNAKPTIDFADTFHNFGSMLEGQVAEYDFQFTNHGREPLIISNAIGSCGCTVANYPHDPIKPGEGGKIEVRFNSVNKSGHVEKSIDIANNSKTPVKILYIIADVTKDPTKATATTNN